MIGTGAAILGASALGTLGSIAAGAMGKEGADQQAASADRAAQLQDKQFQQTREDFAPYRYAGTNALNWLSRGLMGEAIPGQTPYAQSQTQAPTNALAQPQGAMTWQPNGGGGQSQEYGAGAGQPTGGQWVPSAQPATAPAAPAGPTGFADSGSMAGNRNAFMQMFQTSPDYQFRLSEGIKAADRGAAARGMLQSGAQSQALTQYGQNLASGEYGNFINRLSSLAGIGQTATGQTAQAGAQSAANQGNALMAGGQARASGYNAMASGIGSGVNNAMFGLFNYAKQPSMTGSLY